jgi:hypothetical protein
MSELIAITTGGAHGFSSRLRSWFCSRSPYLVKAQFLGGEKFQAQGFMLAVNAHGGLMARMFQGVTP